MTGRPGSGCWSTTRSPTSPRSAAPVGSPTRLARSSEPKLNAFLAEGPERWAEVRAALVDQLAERTEGRRAPCSATAAATLELAWDVADYVDFYASLDHATNVGRLFRPDAEPLLPNWRHLPVGYHGRAGTVVVSGTPIVRPTGQRKGPADPAPVFGPSVRLDIEAEVGFVVGVGSGARRRRAR